MLGFINKDVLSVKIISAAKQNTGSKVVVGLLPADALEGSSSAEGTGMRPRGLFDPCAPLYLSRSHSIDVNCSSVPRVSVGAI